jgi:hypothetical protein
MDTAERLAGKEKRRANPPRALRRHPQGMVGVTVAYLNRSSPNQDLTKEFLKRYALTEEGS